MERTETMKSGGYGSFPYNTQIVETLDVFQKLVYGRAWTFQDKLWQCELFRRRETMKHVESSIITNKL